MESRKGETKREEKNEMDKFLGKFDVIEVTRQFMETIMTKDTNNNSKPM